MNWMERMGYMHSGQNDGGQAPRSSKKDKSNKKETGASEVLHEHRAENTSKNISG